MGRQRGFSLIEAVVALAIAALVVGIPLAVMGSSGRGFAREATQKMHAERVDELLTQLDASAHSAVAIYTPSTCTSASASGDGTSCDSVRFYGVDATGAPHFWGWDYDSATHLLTQCQSYGTNPENGCAQSGGSISVTSFSAMPTDAGTIAARYGVSATGVEKQMFPLDPRVVAGNRVMVVDVADAWLTRTKHLLPEGAPFDAAVVKGAFIPPALGGLGTSLGGSTLIFTTPSSSKQTITASETNYGQYIPYISSPWIVSSCTNGATTIAAPSVVSYSGNDATIDVTPRSVGTCTFTIVTKDQQASIDVVVYAAPIYGLTVSNGPTPSWVYVGGTSSFQITNQLQNPAAVRPSTWPSSYGESVASSGPCSNLGPYGWQSSGAAFTVRLTAAGTCTTTVSGNAGSYQQNDPLTVAVAGYNTPTYMMNVSGPNPSQITATVTRTSFTVSTSLTDGPAGVNVPPGTPQNVPVEVSAASGPCALSPAAAAWYSVSTTFTVSGTAAGTCLFTVAANTSSVANANSIASQRVAVTVVSPVCSNGATNWPTCSTPTPSVSVSELWEAGLVLACVDDQENMCDASGGNCDTGGNFITACAADGIEIDGEYYDFMAYAVTVSATSPVSITLSIPVTVTVPADTNTQSWQPPYTTAGWVTAEDGAITGTTPNTGTAYAALVHDGGRVYLGNTQNVVGAANWLAAAYRVNPGIAYTNVANTGSESLVMEEMAHPPYGSNTTTGAFGFPPGYAGAPANSPMATGIVSGVSSQSVALGTTGPETVPVQAYFSGPGTYYFVFEGSAGCARNGGYGGFGYQISQNCALSNGEMVGETGVGAPSITAINTSPTPPPTPTPSPAPTATPCRGKRCP